MHICMYVCMCHEACIIVCWQYVCMYVYKSGSGGFLHTLTSTYKNNLFPNENPSWVAVNKGMEDIEDLLLGNGGGGAAPGFRLPLNAVGVNPRKNNNKPKLTKLDHPLVSKVPGTQVLLISPCISFLSSFFSLIFFVHFDLLLLQTIYIKTFGCSHNQVLICFINFFFCNMGKWFKIAKYYICKFYW